MRSPSAAKRQQPRRDAVLQAAVEVVAERGVAGVTHRAVTERARVPLTTVSYYFASIDDLVFEAVRRFAEDRVQQVEADLRTIRDHQPDFDEAAAMWTRSVAELPRWKRLAFFEILCSAGRHPELGDPARIAIKAYEHAVRTTLSTVGASVDPAEVKAMVGLAMGYGLLRLADPDYDDPAWLLTAIKNLHAGSELRRPG